MLFSGKSRNKSSVDWNYNSFTAQISDCEDATELLLCYNQSTYAHTLESVLSRFTSLKECISRIVYAQYVGKLPECSFYATAPSSNIKGFTPHSVPFVWVGGQKGTHQHGHCRDFSNIGSLKGTLLLILLQHNLIFDQKPFSAYLLGIFPLFIDPGARKCLSIFSSCFKFS